ncbi:MAG: hypothetical protein K2G26_02675, partial [Clostridia bacterium]|nr:hypothetical protein [Clostridia bacterium]
AAKGAYEHYDCSRCGGQFWDSEGNSACTASELVENELGHDCIDTVTLPTCTVRGSTKHTCTREGCGYEYTDTYVSELGHDWGDWEEATAATCTKKGSEKHICKNDNSHVETRDTDALGHDYQVISGTAPTCTEGGSAEEKCSRCDDERTNSSDEPLGHNIVKVDAVAATCTQDGVKEHYKCDREGCGVLFEDADGAVEITQDDTVAQALGHSFDDEFTIDVDATCTAEGSKSKHCSRCDEVDEVTAIEKAEHEYGEAAYVWNGYESATATFTCVNCGDEQSETATVTCEVTKDATHTEEGERTYTATVTFKDEEYTDVKTEVIARLDKEKVALPVYSGSLKYTGLDVKPSATDFDGFDETIMTFVEDKTVPGVNAGAYKAVFALNDPDRYEWATVTTLKKAVFAVAVYDGETEVVLNANEAAVDWNIAKAKISATKTEGELPVFASDSFTGSLNGIVDLKFYTDQACTEEIAADKLAYSTKYYVKTVLLDGDNFELDETALAFSATAFEYTTPEKQLTVWDKMLKFLKANWLWIVIAVVALILLITIIALIARAAKKKREREEQRRLEEKAERERKEERERQEREERRREEREERMARMSQMQAMPQYIPQPMPQPQPQYVPQAQGQPVAATVGGTVSEAQFLQMQAELKAEISALKAEQSAKEIAALRAEVAMRDDISIL